MKDPFVIRIELRRSGRVIESTDSEVPAQSMQEAIHKYEEVQRSQKEILTPAKKGKSA
jgi:hypothetical protein